MPYTDEFVEFFSGYQFNVNPTTVSPKVGTSNDCVAMFFKVPLPLSQDYASSSSVFTTGVEVNIDRVLISYVETFSEWNLTDNYNTILFNFDSILIPSNGTEIAFNGVEILSSTINNDNSTVKTYDFTRLTDEPSNGHARYSVVPANTSFSRNYRVFHPTSSTSYLYSLDEIRIGEFVMASPIPGVGIGENITVRNGNYFTIARFVYDTDIILPSDTGINFDVGALQILYPSELPFC